MAFTSNKCELIEQNITKIRDSLSQIENSKKKLYENISQAKSNIHTAVSRQLERLRNREIWLVEQVQLLQTTKQKLLDKQSDELCQALGAFESCLNFMTSMGNASHAKQMCQMDCMTSTIEECIRRFEDLEVDITESCYLTFKADVSALKTCIQDFGRIDCECSSATDRDNHTACIQPWVPQHQTACTEPSVNFGDAGVVTGEWLRESKNTSAVHDEPSEPLYQAPAEEWLTERYKCSTSTLAWLSALPNEGDTEYSYDMITAQTDYEKCLSESDIEIVSYGEVESLHTDETVEDRFMHIMQSPNTHWLTSKDLSPATVPFVEMKYFVEVSTSHHIWLQGTADEKKDEDKDACCSGSKCATSNVEIDIENLCELTCVKETTPNPWILPQSVNVPSVCRANELCSTISECVSPEACCAQSVKSVADILGVDKNGQTDWSVWIRSSLPQKKAITAALDEATLLNGSSYNMDIFAVFNVAADEQQWLVSSQSYRDSHQLKSDEKSCDPAKFCESSWLQLDRISPDQTAQKYGDHITNIWLKNTDHVEADLAGKSSYTELFSSSSNFAKDTWEMERDDNRFAEERVWLMTNRCIESEQVKAMMLCSSQQSHHDTNPDQCWLIS